MQETEEVEIDLRDLLGRLLIKWRACLVFAVVFAAIIWLLTLIAPRFESLISDMHGQTFFGGNFTLTDEEIKETEQAYLLYKSYLTASEDQQDYAEHSILLTLNPEEAIVTRRLYFVQSQQANIVSVISGLVLNADLYKEIADYVGDEAYADFAYELLDISDYSSTAPQSSAQSKVELSTTGQRESVMSVIVYGPSEEFCQDIHTIVEKSIRKASEQLEQRDAGLKVDLLSEDRMTGTVSLINSKRQSILTNVSNQKGSIKTYEESLEQEFTPQQMKYFQELKESEGLDDTPDIIIWNDARYFVFGFVIGLLVYAVGFVTLPYISEGTIRTADEAETAYGARRLQTIYLSSDSVESKDKIKSYGEKLRRKGDNPITDIPTAMSMVADEIACRLNKDAVEKRLFIYGDPSMDDNLHIKENIERVCGNKVKTSIGLTEGDAKNFADLLSADAIVFTVEIDRTQRKDIGSLLRVCHDNEIPVLGYISIR